MGTPAGAALIDGHGRVIRDLRISVTPRCNLHCTYCSPLEGQHPEPQGVLSVQEVEQFLAASVRLGLDSVRFTGGEPLLRHELPQMIAAARSFPQIRDIAITTNGTLFRRRHPELISAGLNRINISLDALEPKVFSQITGGGQVQPVLDAIDLSLELGLHPVKVNAVILRGVNESEIAGLAALAVARPLNVRFIEYMHLNNAQTHDYARAFISGAEVKARIELEFGKLVSRPVEPSSPARVFSLKGAQGTIGFINPVSQPFCTNCSRMRLTADKKLRPCLLTDRELDATEAFNASTPIKALMDLLQNAAHSKELQGQTLPVLRERTMVAIGG